MTSMSPEPLISVLTVPVHVPRLDVPGAADPQDEVVHPPVNVTLPEPERRARKAAPSKPETVI